MKTIKVTVAFAALFCGILTSSVPAALIQHLDAFAGGNVTGNPVSVWADQSGVGNHASNAVGSVYYPSESLSASGKQGLNFGTNDNCLVLFSTAESDRWLDQTSGNGFCVFIAFKADGIIGAWNDLIGNSTSTSAGFGMRYGSDGNMQAYLGGKSINKGGAVVSAGDTLVYAFNYDASSETYTWWDSKNNLSDTDTLTAADFSVGNNGVTLGRTTSGSRYFNGMVGEVKVYDAALTPAEFETACDALAAKWVEVDTTPIPRTNGPPNIVFILADDLGYGDLSCYGHPHMRTPELDQLAAEGTRFESFHVTGTTCCPSRTGFLTSRHPASYPDYMSNHGFADQVTVTELLHENGYTIGHFGKWHIGPIDRDGTYGMDEIGVLGGGDDTHDGRDTDVFSAAMNFIENNAEKPFYVNVWGHISHYQVNPHESLVEDFNDFTLNRADFPNAWFQDKLDIAQEIIDYYSLPEDLTMGMRNYMGDVYSLDINVGYLLDKIGELGLSTNTIVVFSSDQGAAPVFDLAKVINDNRNPDSQKNMLGYGGPFRGGKHTQLEGGVRAPFIVRWPGQVPAGLVNSNSTISALDWLPTLCSIAAVEIDPVALGLEGEDISDILYGATRSPDRPLFWRASNVNGNPAMLEGKWKLHRENPTSGAIELYNLDTDPAELNNLAAVRTDIVDIMIPKLEAWQATLPEAYDKNTHVSPIAPVANAGPDQVVEDLYNNGVVAVTLDASASSDSDGFISSCLWRKDGQIVAVTDGPTVSLPAGTHTLEVEVTDYAGNTDFDTVSITVNAYIDRYGNWVDLYGGAGLLGQETHDFDGDGVANFSEYALVGNPTNEMDNGKVPTLMHSGGSLFYVHPRRSDDPSLIYTVETSTNLISADWTDSNAVISGTNDAGTVFYYVTNRMPVAEDSMFIRLKVEK